MVIGIFAFVTNIPYSILHTPNCQCFSYISFSPYFHQFMTLVKCLFISSFRKYITIQYIFYITNIDMLLEIILAENYVGNWNKKIQEKNHSCFTNTKYTNKMTCQSYFSYYPTIRSVMNKTYLICHIQYLI